MPADGDGGLDQVAELRGRRTCGVTRGRAATVAVDQQHDGAGVFGADPVDVPAEQVAHRGASELLPGRRLRDQQDVGPVQVDAQSPAPLGETGGIALRVTEQIADQLAPYPVLGLGDGAAQQQEESGDDGGAFVEPPVGVVEPVRPVQHQAGEEFVAA